MLQFFADTTCEVFDGSFGSCICGIVARECSKKCCGDRDELPAVSNVLRASLQDEECRFGVDSIYWSVMK
jgi:hypothetical protein